MNAAIILPLDVKVSLDVVGGKGLNLSRLYRAGFPIPPGFVVSTTAYEAFVQTTGLTEVILDEIQDIQPDDLSALETASKTIRARFSSYPLPDSLVTHLAGAYSALNQRPVAVRSSATAEDLPGFSYAGQQDTYLNVVGEVALRKAVVDCWSSLWTARAIGYRARNGIDHATISLAVVVQEMVSSESSGVLFTANPITGKRSETVIDAIFGLGEALVSGLVEPDHYVVDADGRILSKTLGNKELSIRNRDDGGTITVIEQNTAVQQVLSDAVISELFHLGNRVTAIFGVPQDIEWAFVKEQLYLLQSRPITTLFPLPEGLLAEPLKFLFSFGGIQGMLDPITPLGRDMMCRTVVGGAKLFGYRLDPKNQQVFLEAGERLWVNMSGLINNRLGRKVTLAALEYIEPGAKQALINLLRDGSLVALDHLRPITFLRLIKALLPVVWRALRTMACPLRQRDILLQNLETWFEDWRVAIAASKNLSNYLALIKQIPDDAFEFILPQFVPRFGMGMAMYNLLTKLVTHLPGDQPDTMVMMRGLPHNVTTEMDLNLWNTAQEIRADALSLAHFVQTDIATLADEFLSGQLPDVAHTSISAFINRYGMRGLGEIDLGRSRWREDPSPLMQTIQSYLQIDDPALAPDQVYERGRQAAEVEIDRLVQMLHSTRRGWFKARLAQWSAKRMRALAGLRETPKFYIVRLFDLIRRALLVEGVRLVDEGVVDYSDDVFFMHLAELQALATGDHRDWKSLVRARRQVNLQEQLRKQLPRLLLSDGRAFYEGVSSTTEEGQTADQDILVGYPVSPGVVEGPVCIVHDPRATQLKPGDILVCPGTDPSWTPLFLVAGGLVMEVGGMMTHGAVVAREYGLPAVVGIHEATKRLHTGQRVRVDGSLGQVLLLKD